MSNFIEIDGSVLEGGGQILRISISLSAIMGIPIRVTKIRMGRKKPGLAAQHLKGIQLVGQMCQAKMKGVDIGSTEIEFVPGKLRGGNYVADTQTAGSISLLLQVALPCALLADGQVTLELKGGTNAEMAPQVDYLTEVFRPILEKFGGTFDFVLHTRGYYPKGGGHVTVNISPVTGFKPVTLVNQGKVTNIHGWSYVAGTLPIKLSHQMSDGAKSVLSSLGTNIDIDCYKESRDVAINNCSGIILVSETSEGCVLGSDGLGQRDRSHFQVGQTAGQDLLKDITSGACLDQYSQDQVIVYMALANGKSSVKLGEITLHTKTAILIAETIAKVSFTTTSSGSNNIIECNGLGFNNKYMAPS